MRNCCTAAQPDVPIANWPSVYITEQKPKFLYFIITVARYNIM